MKEMFTSLKGLQVLLQGIALAVNIAVYSNSIVGMPGKENNFYYCKNSTFKTLSMTDRKPLLKN